MTTSAYRSTIITVKQAGFLRTLIGETYAAQRGAFIANIDAYVEAGRGYDDEGDALDAAQALSNFDAQNSADELADIATLPGMTAQDASRRIDVLLGQAKTRKATERAATRAPGPALDDGMYRLGDSIYRVRHGRQNGRQYAMWFDPEARTLVYARGIITKLTPHDRLTLIEVEAMSVHFGVCCVCGRELTADTSVKRGIGPVCRTRI